MSSSRRTAAAVVASVWLSQGVLAFLAPLAPVPSTYGQPRNALRTGRAAAVMYARKKTKLDEELESLRLDESNLSETERKELSALRESYGLDAVLDFDGEGKGALSSSKQDDPDYDPLDDAEDVAVEKTPWSGQAGLDVEVEATNSYTDLQRRPFLAAGDIAALTIFAAIGRSFHSPDGVSLNLATLTAAAPFIVGWLSGAPLLGAYSPDATENLPKVFGSLAKAWAVALPLSLAIRAASKGELPPVPFVGVSLVMTFVLLGAWRTLYVALNGAGEEGSKSGGVFDLFRMVTTLINRW